MKQEARGIADNEKAKTTTDKDSDSEFMEDLTEQCQDKAAAWDARSKTRSAELTAIAGALATLKGEVSANYNANKKLVGFVTKHSQVGQHKGHWEWVADKSTSTDKS